MNEYKNPIPTVDIIIELDVDDTKEPAKEKKVVLIYRKNYPNGWALPGGFVDYGESLEEAAAREAYEETSLSVRLIRQFHTYSNPDRDPRQHTITTVYIARAEGTPKAADDAQKAAVFSINDLPENIVFDHAQILEDYHKDVY